MKFRDYFAPKQMIFALCIILLMIFFAVIQSNNLVKVYLEEDHLEVISDHGSFTVQYDEIASAELVTMPSPGEKADEDAWDDDLLRTGNWKNDTWGSYFICADLDPTNCIVLHLTDGQTLVFSRKNDATNQELYDELLTHIKK